MSFFAPPSSSFKPPVRQEGFHLPSPAPSASTPPPQHFDPALFAPHHYLPDAFRKFPDTHSTHSMDFTDELASLMNPPPRPRSPEYRPHNIFDISAPHSAPPYAPREPADFPHFNSTLPALNSSLRYDPHPDPPPPPSSFPAAFRHSPSPAHRSRSRSRSRPPVAPGPGPTRTTRARRTNSVSSVSPPPAPRPIVIPGARPGPASAAPASPLSLHSLSSAGGWFVPSHAHSPSAEYALPTPDSLHAPPGLHAFAAFGLPAPPKDAPDKQALLAHEKRRRRRESHNAVERRRRDNINEKISELATLIPECMLDPSAPAPASPDDTPAPEAAAAKREDDPDAAGVVKANKGMILRKSVEYIRYLQQLVSAQSARNRSLERALAALRPGDGAADAPAADTDPARRTPTPSGSPREMLLHEDAFAYGAYGFGAIPEGGEMDVEAASTAGEEERGRRRVRRWGAEDGDAPAAGSSADEEMDA